METFDEVLKTIQTEIVSDDPEVRSEYLAHFKADIEKFTPAMARAFIEWRLLDNEVKGDEKRAYVSGLVFTAIILHILSLKLFISGHTVAAGNLMRQVLESIAVALLCAGKDIGILEQFMSGEYMTNAAIRDVTKHSSTLGLKEDGVKSLADAQKFYHKYSHPTMLTLATGISLSKKGLFVGAGFDKGKLKEYSREINGRVVLQKFSLTSLMQ